MQLPKSKSWVKARYAVMVDGKLKQNLCQYDATKKRFVEKVTVRAFGQGSWTEWRALHNVTSWVRVDDLLTCQEATK